jgi:aspartate 1-decarboxylase
MIQTALYGVKIMQRLVCKGKIHQATVTEAELDYDGSITIVSVLMKEADIKPFEIVQVTNLRNATRWKTYAVPDEANSGVICLNGPPAHLFEKGDLVIILSMGLYEEEEIENLKPKVLFVNEKNQITHIEEHSIKGKGLANDDKV